MRESFRNLLYAGAKLEHLIGDRAYDGNGLDDDLPQDRVSLIARMDLPASSRPSRPFLPPLSTPLARRTDLRLALGSGYNPIR
jgi:hypothetical protein